MGVSAKFFTDLGISGAALFVVIHLINKIFKYLEKRSSSEDRTKGNKFDRLCEKIDHLVDSFHEMTQKMSEVMLNSNRDQQDISNLLNKHTDLLIDIQKKVVRIDDRTYKCLGDERKVIAK